MDSWEISFGRFRLDLRRRELRHNDQPVRIHRRALGILCALAEAKGEIVSKDELMARLWPGRVVEEGNLYVHVTALRKSLDEHGEGHSFVITVPGRGYRLADLTGLRSAQLAGGSLPQPLPLPDKPSIAVMPFANLSGDPDQEYFADGMVEEIITALSRIKWLFVIARNSSFTYKGRAVDVNQVGRELGVRYVLEGSVRKAGNQVRITGQLIDAVTRVHLCADNFDGVLENIFDLQERVAISVSGVVEPALQAAEMRRSEKRPTNDLGAYDLYLRSLPVTLVWGRSSIIPAIDLLEQAIERDPRYGPALALKAICHMQLHINGWSNDPEADGRQSVDLARRALVVAGDDPIVLSNAAHALGYFEENIEPAIALMDRSLELNPSSASSWYRSGQLRLYAGQPECGITHFETSVRLNPRRPGPGLWGLGLGHFFARRFDRAAELLLQSLQEGPNWAATYRFLASCYAHMGRLDEARQMVERLRSITPLVVPSAAHWRNPADRALYLDGLRLAAGE
jgi:TolB-like protein